MKQKQKIREGMSFYKLDNKWFSTYPKDTYESTLSILMLLNVHTNRQGYAIFTVNYLMSVFDVNVSSRKSIKRIKESLQFLYETNHFVVHKSFYDDTIINVNFNNVNVYDTFCIELTPPKKNYTMIYFNEVDSILRYDGLEFRYRRNLLRLFCTLISHINNYSLCCFPSIETLSEETRIQSKTTCLKYIEILKDLGLIISDSASISLSKSGVTYTPYNIYARPEHSKELEIKVKLQYMEYSKKYDSLLKDINKLDGKKRRSLKQKMNYLDKERQFRDLTAEEEERYLDLKVEYDDMEYKKITKEDLDDAIPKDCHVDESDLPQEDIMESHSNIIEFPTECGIKVDINADRGTTIIERISQDCDGW